MSFDVLQDARLNEADASSIDFDNSSSFTFQAVADCDLRRDCSVSFHMKKSFGQTKIAWGGVPRTFDRTNIHATGSLAGTGGGSTWLFPPTVLAQYHFDGFGALKAYVGAGVNYTAFFNEGTSGLTRT